ncbi:MAG: cytochrome c oxidase assembly protein, partial [Vicinamibacterales bacterium]
MRRGSLLLGLGVLAAAWLGPLPALASGSFAAHMTMHIGVVAVAAPLL